MKELQLANERIAETEVGLWKINFIQQYCLIKLQKFKLISRANTINLLIKMTLMLYFILTPYHSYALTVCQCGPERDVVQQYRNAFGVFTGTVTKIKRQFNPQRRKIFFDVHQSWKGVKNKTVSVYTSGTDVYSLIREGVTCGYKFEKGKTYLIYSYRHRRKRGPAYVSNCGGIKIFTESKNGYTISGNDLKVLGKPIFEFIAFPL